MARRVAIHRTAIVAPDVEIGDGTVIGPYALVLAPCTIGRDCRIGPLTVLGSTAEHVEMMTVPAPPPDASDELDDAAREGIDELLWFGPLGAGVVLGDRTTVREHCTVHQGTHGPTMLGDDVYMMNKSHIGHDASIGDRVRIAPLVMVGGHTWAGPDANLGMASSIHQNRVIGTGAMVGMHATVVKDVAPHVVVMGNPARPRGVNRVGMERRGFSEAQIDAVARYYETEGQPPPEVIADDLRAWEQERASG